MLLRWPFAMILLVRPYFLEKVDLYLHDLWLTAAIQAQRITCGHGVLADGDRRCNHWVAHQEKAQQGGAGIQRSWEPCRMPECSIKTRLCVEAYLFSLPEERKSITVKSSNVRQLHGDKKDVISFLIADSTMPMRVTLWGQLATEEHPRLERAMQAAGEGEFVRVKLEQVETRSIDNSSPIPLMQLQSTAATKVSIQEPGAFVIRPPRSIMVTRFLDLEPCVAPKTCNLQGHVDMVGQLRYSQDDIPMRDLRLVDGEGVAVPLMLFGENAEVPVDPGCLVSGFYIQFQAPLPEKENEGGYGWLYDTSMLLIMNAASKTVPKAKQMIKVRGAQPV